MLFSTKSAGRAVSLAQPPRGTQGLLQSAGHTFEGLTARDCRGAGELTTALQLETTRTGFVAAAARAPATETFDDAQNGGTVRRHACRAGVRCPGNHTAATVVAAC